MVMQRQVKEAIRLLQRSMDDTIKSRKNRKRDSRSPPPSAYKAERGLVMVWGMYRGWSGAAIARAACAAENTVINFRSKLGLQPSKLFDYPVLHQGLRGSKPLYRCGLCGDLMTKSLKDAREHVVLHFMSPEVMKANGFRG